MSPITVWLSDGRRATLTWAGWAPARGPAGYVYVRSILDDGAVRWVWLPIGWERWALDHLSAYVEPRLT